MPDTRNPLLITHAYSAMVTAQMIVIAADYEDANDLAALRHDRAQMIARNSAPEGGHDIPSQQTFFGLEKLADVCRSTRPASAKSIFTAAVRVEERRGDVAWYPHCPRPVSHPRSSVGSGTGALV